MQTPSNTHLPPYCSVSKNSLQPDPPPPSPSPPSPSPLLLNIPWSLLAILSQHPIHHLHHILLKLQINTPLAPLQLVSQFLRVRLKHHFLYFLASHRWKQHFFLRKVDVFVACYCFPDVLHVARHVCYRHVVMDKLSVLSTLDQHLFKRCYAFLPILLLSLLQFGRKEEDCHLENILESVSYTHLTLPTIYSV